MDLTGFEFIKPLGINNVATEKMVTISSTTISLNAKLTRDLWLPNKGRAKVGINPITKVLCICFVPYDEKTWTKYTWVSEIGNSGIVFRPTEAIKKIDILTSLTLKDMTYRFEPIVHDGMIFVDLLKPIQIKRREKFGWHKVE